jgi:branched-chain amino acid transport system permease protein
MGINGDHFWLAMLLGTATAGVASLVVSIPSVRLSGLFLALLTMAFALMVDNVIFTIPQLTGTEGGMLVGRPAFWGTDYLSDVPFYYLCLGFLVVFGGIALLLRSSRVGRRLQALRDSPDALATLGVSLATTKLFVFALTSAMAGAAGVLFATYQGTASSLSFSMFSSVNYLVAAVLGGIGSVGGGVVGGVLLALPQIIKQSGTFNDYFNLGIGIVAVQVALYPNGLVDYWAHQAQGLLGLVRARRQRRLLPAA